jgi:arsenate reductase
MSEDFPITIFHNPDCGTSRNALAMIRAAGYAPTVVEYLKTGWTRPQLERLLGAMGAGPRDMLREKGTPAAELGLLDPVVGDDQLLDAMVAHPILVNRPIVVTPKGVRLCRPSELVLTLLDDQPASFTKEDGHVVQVSTETQVVRPR